MSRKVRRESSTGLYHVIVRGNNKQRLFHRKDDFDYFLELIGKRREKDDVTMHHYCLMGNHVHLLVRTATKVILGRFMHGIQRAYHHYYRRKYTIWGHLFQGRFRSYVIEDEGYLLECGRYIERNPVRAKLVKKPADWHYSSYSYYAGGKPSKWLAPSVGYLALSKNKEQREKIYRERVEHGRPYEEEWDRKLLKS